MVGTGDRGTSMWGIPVIDEFKDLVEFVGLCDINAGRVETAKKILGVSCATYTDFDKMMKEMKPDRLIVTTVDATHNEYIIKGMEYGADIITEKPFTTDEHKCQDILDAEKKTGKKIAVTFNYRYSPHRQKIYELLRSNVIGDITSVDFHWYLDVYHGADYFRRWHRLRKNSGSLLVHKASHHFDLLNWWIDSEPEEVFAFGSDIDIFDKMAVQIKYASKVQVSYSLTAYSPYEGYRISFNGKKGKLDAWIKERQPWEEDHFDEMQITTSFGKKAIVRIDNREGGHGGGDARLRKHIFNPGNDGDTWNQAAGSRDGAMSCLIGIAARNSIDTGKPVRIEDLVSIKPQAKRPTG